MNALIVAIRSSDPRFAGHADGLKSLIPIGGKPALSRLVASLKGSKAISQVIVAGDEAGFAAATDADQYVPGATEAAAVVSGLRAAEGAERCLIMAGDMPLATPEALDDLFTSAPQADVVYPVTTHGDMEEVFPGRKTAYLKTREGQVTGSSCLLVRPDAVLPKSRMLTSLLEARKNPGALLSLIGVGLGLKMMFSTLSLTDFERHLSEALGLSCRVFLTHYPELLFSVDNPDDVQVAERELRNR